ncbi:hypothetical protein EMIT053CA3_10063 [Pseudomonas donghuensis]
MNFKVSVGHERGRGVALLQRIRSALWLVIPSGQTSSTAKSARMPSEARSSPSGFVS